MATKYLNIPKNILVGIKNSQGFVTYKKGSKIAKESTWGSWTGNGEKKDFENNPVEGFKLVNCIGGQGGSWYSYNRRAWAIVKDPRGFEVEITFDNLIWIMQQLTHDVEKGFVGELVYGWDGVQMMLVPSVSKDYQYTKKIDDVETQYKLKDCIPGRFYKYPNSGPMVYLGYLPIIVSKTTGEYDNTTQTFSTKKYHCFKYLAGSSWTTYETVTSTKKSLIDVTQNRKVLTNHEINEDIRKLYKAKFGNESFENINIVKMIPVSDSEKRMNNLISWIEQPYKANLDKYGYWKDNCDIHDWNGPCSYALMLFNKDKTEVIKYHIIAIAEVGGLNRTQYVDKCSAKDPNWREYFYSGKRKEIYDKYNAEFTSKAQRIINVQAACKYEIKEGNIVQKSTLENQYKLSAKEFIENNRDNIYVMSHYTDNFEKCVKLVTDTGFEFMTKY